jgi:probable phosphoglycerate mutase
VRHAVTAVTGRRLPGRAPGLHLSAEGRRQAERVAQRLARLPRVAAVYTSPLERARETAATIARTRGLGLRVERGLLELDVGAWTGITLARARRKREWTTVQRHPSGFRFPEGESFAEMQARVTAAITALVARHPGATIIAVSHADPIKAAAAQAVGAPLDLFQRIVIAPASVTAIAYSAHGPLVLTLNSVDGDIAGLVGGRSHAAPRAGHPPSKPVSRTPLQ